MVRRVSPAQARSMMQQAQRKQKQAVDSYNRQVRKHNQGVKREVDKINRDINTHNQKARRDVNRYNSEVRAHNSRVRANRQRLKNEIRKLESRARSDVYSSHRTSTNVVTQAYQAVERRENTGDFNEAHNEVLELAEREAANSAGVMNALLDQDTTSAEFETPPNENVLNFLMGMSSDLVDRWNGALFSLNLRNPDAARHFCTSAREVITQILEIKAPNDTVKQADENVSLTPNGTPTRRSKIAFMLKAKGLWDETLEDFILADIDNVIDLFKVFNDGTHGSAGKFTIQQLIVLRSRVEDALGFLSKLSL